MLEIAEASGGLPRAFVRIGGGTVAGQQLAIALALGCERVVCIAPALTPDIVALQHRAEKAGAQFNVVPGAHPLLGLVTAADEVIAFADGLFASREQARKLLDGQQAVLVQPIEQGLAAGFERIDLNHAAAGAMRVPGRLVERLGDLPADCDVVSSLQRIALQAGVRQALINVAGTSGGFWALVHGDAEAHAIEPQWIRQHSQDAIPAGPSRATAMLAVRSFGPAILHAGSGSGALVTGALVGSVLAFGAGWFGFISLGLGLSALGWFLREFAALLARVETESDPKKITTTGLSAYAWITDFLLVALIGWSGGPEHAVHAERFFPALMLVAMLRILAEVDKGRWSSWIADRGMVALLFVGAIAGRIAFEAAHLGAIAVVVLVLLAIGRNSRLTRP